MYFFNINRLAGQYLPRMLRGGSLEIWIQCLLYPIRSLQEQFTAFRETSEEEVWTNGQVCRLRYTLNKLYDPVQKRITVTDSTDRPNYDFDVNINDDAAGVLILYNDPAKYVYFYDNQPVIISDETDSSLTQRVTDTVNRYKLFGKKFRVVVL